jgi:type I restriction enzyme, S subunit
MPTAVEPGPADWQVVRLGDIASIVLGGTPSTAVPSFWGGDINWMSSGEVNVKQVWDVAGRITEAGLASSNATMVDPPAVAIGLAGQGKTRGTAALVHTRLCTNQSIALVRGHDGLALSRFLYHNLDRRYEELRAVSSGGGRGGLSRSILKDVDVLLPPLREQHRISDILDAVDVAIHETEGIVAKLTRTKLGLLNDLLTRGVDENGEIRPSPDDAPSLYKDTALGRLPMAWDVGRLRECICGTPQNGLYKPESSYSTSGTPIVRIDGFVNGGLISATSMRKVRLSLSEVEAYRLVARDMLINRVNSIDFVGKAALVPAFAEAVVFESNMMRVRVRSDRLLPEFAIMWIRSPRCQNFFHTRAKSAIAQASINQTDVGDAPTPLPPRQEQERIAAVLATAEALIDCEAQNRNRHIFMRQGLMDDLLTGRVRVHVPERAEA